LREARSFDREEVARHAGVSVRRLQRRLADERRDFREVRDGVLRRIACEELANGAGSVDAIAARLGFNEASAFGKAFKRRPGRYCFEPRVSDSTTWSMPKLPDFWRGGNALKVARKRPT
jgi:transcriptional regulator GlxA family with amidase domain